jgi:hypothetical protein
MTNPENHLNSASAASATPEVETIYTVVESQEDRTDWLTVVSNLRQEHQKLRKEIAIGEQTLATVQQNLHICREEKQAHEIAILQQQDEIKASQERITALFSQLETSHQIGQRQQTLVETLSQQLEITQAIVPALEAENNELRQQNQHQSQQLIKAEQIIRELHRRLMDDRSNPANTPMPTAAEVAVTTPAPKVDRPFEKPALPQPELPMSSTDIEVTDKVSEEIAVPQPQPPAAPRYITPTQEGITPVVETPKPEPTPSKKLKIDLPKFPKKS